MAKKVMRRANGAETVPFFAELDPSVDNTIKRLTHDLQLPQWAVIELAIKNLAFDADGIPVGWNVPHPQNEELPIPAA